MRRARRQRPAQRTNRHVVPARRTQLRRPNPGRTRRHAQTISTGDRLAAETGVCCVSHACDKSRGVVSDEPATRTCAPQSRAGPTTSYTHVPGLQASTARHEPRMQTPPRRPHPRPHLSPRTLESLANQHPTTPKTPRRNRNRRLTIQGWTQGASRGVCRDGAMILLQQFSLALGS